MNAHESDCTPITVDVSSLMSDSERLKAMILDVGRFLSAFLSQRHPCTVETHTELNPRQRALRMKNGAELHELLVEDGEATFSQNICNGRVMAQLDTNRREAEYSTNHAWVFTRLYLDFLTQMDMLCSSRCKLTDVVEFQKIVVESVQPACIGEHRETIIVDGYFHCISIPYASESFRNSRLSSNGVVEVGRFANGLSNYLEEKIDAWIEALQHSISESCEDCKGVAHHTTGGILQSVKGMLCRLISSHVSMEDCFDTRTSTVCRNITANNLEAIVRRVSKLAQPQFEASINDQKRQLSLLRGLCTISTSSKLVEVVKKFGGAILMGIKVSKRIQTSNTTAVLASKAHDFQLDRIASIVRSATKPSSVMQCDVVLAVQLGDWQRDVGSRALDALASMCDACISTLCATAFPDAGFVPTLKHLHTVPAPTWTYVPDVDVPIEAAKAQLPSGSQRTTRGPDAKLPAETMLTLRIISVVWELSACRETNDAYFTQGRVLASAVRQVTYMHQVAACFAMTLLKNRLQQHRIGQNYRNALRSIAEFRGAEFENDVRMAVQCVSRWSVQELMAVCSEDSPMFAGNLFRVMDATLSSMVNRPSLGSAAIIVRTLLSARPILIDLRSEAGIERRRPSSDVVDMLMSIPAIRNWDGTGDELVLTHDEASLGITGTTDALRQMSSNRHVVSYRRRGTKRVYSFNCPDLAKLIR